jgi:TPR repeat protein
MSCGATSRSRATCATSFALSALLQLLVAPLLVAATGDLKQGNGGATEQRHYVAFSLKTAEAMVQKAQQNHIDFRQDHALFGLGGMSRPKAIFFDPETKDWILLGERSSEPGDLTLDDFAVAMRTRFRYTNTDPGVTIEPIAPGEGTTNLAQPPEYRTATRQQVKFYGSLQNTRFGLTCYEADWLMKRIGLGLEKLPNVPIPSFFDIARNQEARHGSFDIVSRFWMCPVLSEVPILQTQKAVFLQEMQMMVKTEALYAELNGKVVLDKNELGDIDVAGKKFAYSFTDYYEAASRDRPLLDRLRGLARLAGLTKGIVVGKWASDFQYFLHDYQFEATATPPEVDVLQNKDNSLGMALRGGIQLRQLATRLRNGDITALVEAVIKMRPKTNSIAWDFAFGDTFLPLPKEDGPSLDYPGSWYHTPITATSEETQWWCNAADDGNVDAMLLVAECCFFGEANFPKDLAKAFAWWQKAATAGSAAAMCEIAACHLRGEGVDKDTQQALEWTRKAVTAGDAHAMCNLGLIYRDGLGVPADHSLAVYWYLKAANAGDVPAMTDIAVLYMEAPAIQDRSYLKAKEWLLKAANGGDAVAMWNLGDLYFQGDAVPLDYSEAMAWFMKGAKVGFEPAMNSVGHMYMNGLGVSRDYTKAMYWFREAADRGFPLGMKNIALLYQFGWGVPMDREQAAVWRHKADNSPWNANPGMKYIKVGGDEATNAMSNKSQ